VKKALPALAALALAGCEVYAVPSPVDCPGARVGTFDVAGDQVLPLDPPPPAGCFFADPSSASYQVKQTLFFNGSLYVGGPATTAAALCIGAPHAAPRIGTIADDGTFTVSYVNLTGSIAGCTCPSSEAVTAGRCACPVNSQLTGCSCPAVIQETIRGLLQHDSQGVLTGFAGSQTVDVSPPPGVPSGTPVCDCQVACSFSYSLAATTVGAP